MDFVLTPSHDHATIVNRAIALWTEDLVREEAKNLFASCPAYLMEGEWKKIEQKVLQKAQDLPLYDSLRKQIVHVVRPVGLEILDWLRLIGYKEYCHQVLGKDTSLHSQTGRTASLPAIDFIQDLRWTMQGTVDKESTAQVFLDNESLAVKYRYEVACICCHEHCVPVLWLRMSQQEREMFCSSTEQTFDELKRLFDFWTCFARCETDNMDCRAKGSHPHNVFCKHMFVWSIGKNNELAARYFWGKMHAEERIGELTRFAIEAVSGDCVEILCFLLTQMDHEQQQVFLRNHHFAVLRMFCRHWLWRDFFVSTVDLLWNFLSADDFYHLLLMITEEMSQDDQGADKYGKILISFWKKSPYIFRRSIINSMEHIWRLLSKLFSVEAEECIGLIISRSTFGEKKQIAFSRHGKNHLSKLVRECKWDLIKVFMASVFESDADLNDFKTVLIDTVSSDNWLYFDPVAWEMVQEFLSWRCTSEDMVKDFRQKITHRWDREFIEFVRFREWELLDMLLSWRFATEEEVVLFKRRLARWEGTDFCVQLLLAGDWPLVEEFLDWSCLTPEGVSKFKQDLAHGYGADVCWVLIRDNDWEAVERFVNWCDFASEEALKSFKKNVLECVGIYLCTRFMLSDELQLANRFLEWCDVSEGDIWVFKANLAKTQGSYLFREFAHNTMYQEEKVFGIIDAFLNWCFPSQEEVDAFKRYVLIDGDKGRRFCIHMIEDNKFRMADSFLRWCCLPNKEIKELKHELMLSDEGISLCKRFIRSEVYDRNKKLLDEWEMVSLFIEWCDQSKQTLVEFRNKFLNDDRNFGRVNRLETFFGVLEKILVKTYLIENVDSEEFSHIDDKIGLNYLFRATDVCAALICNDKWELVIGFLKWRYTAVEEVAEFKKSLCDLEGVRICAYLIKHSKLNVAESFLKWCYSCEEAISNFKRLLLDQDGVKICVSFIRGGSIHEADEFLRWCLESGDGVSEFKKKIAEEEGSRLCAYFVQYYCILQLADQFISWCFSSEVDSKKFKKEFVDREIIRICVHLMEYAKLDYASEFVSWCFASEKEARVFKKHVLPNYKERIFDNLVFIGEHNAVGKFLLEWCGLSDKEADRFKTERVRDKAAAFCSYFIKSGKWEMADEFLSWGRLAEEEEKRLKEELAGKDHCSLCTRLIIFNSLESAEKFLNWCFPTQEEVANFKKEKLSSCKEAVCLQLIAEGKFESADAFLKWCRLCDEEIEIFKRELMLSERGIRICCEFVEGYKMQDTDGNVLYSDKWELISRLFEWYNQPNKVMLELKDKLQQRDLKFKRRTDLNTFLSLVERYALNH